MAHELESSFYFGEVPWHGLGTPVEGALTSQDALVKAGLDWEVEIQPVFIHYQGNPLNAINIPDAKAVVRKTDGAALGVVGNRYTPVQNVEAFKFFDGLTQGNFAMYHTAGSLRGGKKTWILAKLPDVIKIRDDVVDKYLLLYNSFDGTTPFSVQFTPVRVVCMNTLTMALGQVVGERFRMRHTTNVMSKVSSAQQLLGLTNQFYVNFQEIANRMAVLALPAPKMENYIISSLGIKEEDKAMWRPMEQYAFTKTMELVEVGKTTPQSKGTLWGAYNAVTEYEDHWKKNQDRTSRFEFSLLGSGAELKQNAFAQALELLK